jgi:hypothetical protein
MTAPDDESNRSKMAQLLRELEYQMSTPAYAEQNRILAKNLFDRFQAFMAAGFTPEQALTLVAKP